MNNTTRLMYGMMMLALMFGSLLQAEDESPIVADTEASCVLKISADPDILPLSSDLIDRLFQSSGVYAEAIKIVFGEDPSDIETECNLELVSETSPDSPELPMGMPGRMGGAGMVGGIGGGIDAGSGGYNESSGQQPSFSSVYSLYVVSKTGSANELMMKLARNLQNAIEQPYTSRQEELKAQLRATEARIDEKQDQFIQRQEQWNAMIISGVTNREELQIRMNDLRQQIQKQALNYEVTQSHLHQFEEEKAKLTTQMEEAVNQDPILKELSSLVDDAQASVERFKEKVAAGQLPEGQISEAKERLARTKIELAKRTEELRDKAGQKQLMDLNNKFQQTVSSLSEQELLEKNAKMKLDETVQLFSQVGVLDILEMNYGIAKEALNNLLKAKVILENQLESLKKPSVVVIGGTE